MDRLHVSQGPGEGKGDGPGPAASRCEVSSAPRCFTLRLDIKVDHKNNKIIIMKIKKIKKSQKKFRLLFVHLQVLLV